MEDGKKYKIAQKVGGIWRNYGNVAKNKYGSWSLGLRLTPEFVAVIQSMPPNTWLNLSLFPIDEDGKKDKPKDEF